MNECTTLRLEQLRLGTYGLTHLRLLQSRLGKLRLDLTPVQSRLVGQYVIRVYSTGVIITPCARVVARVKLMLHHNVVKCFSVGNLKVNIIFCLNTPYAKTLIYI